MSGNKTQMPPAPTPGGRYDTPGGTMPSTPGGTNVSMWNTRFDAAAAGAPVVPQKWNTRFDWQPSRAEQTYRGGRAPNGGLGGDGTMVTGLNAKKPF